MLRLTNSAVTSDPVLFEQMFIREKNYENLSRKNYRLALVNK